MFLKISTALVALIVTISCKLDIVFSIDSFANSHAEASSINEEIAINPEDIHVNLLPGMQPLELLKRSLQNEVAAHPNLYIPEDVHSFMNNRDGLSAENFLRQRSNDWKRAYSLAVSALRWRADMGLDVLTASHFPCDLFSHGLIFEHGKTHHHVGHGHYAPGNPVIWIRLGALGSVVKHLEQFTPRRVTSFSINSVQKTAKKSQDLIGRFTRIKRLQNRSSRGPLVTDLSVKNEVTISHTLRAMAWWLNDWVRRHPPGSQATLVLDFENTDFAFSSWSMGEFLVKLDDYFPGLFDQIIGFRYRPKLWSFHTAISMFNRIFKSRISSSPETDRKLKFVKSEPQISAYMPRVDVDGFTMLPEHVSGNCVGLMHQIPEGCQPDANELAKEGLYNMESWHALQNQFYQLCKPKRRE